MDTKNRNTPNHLVADGPSGVIRRSVPFYYTPGRSKRKKTELPVEVLEESNELADQLYRYYRPANTAERDMVDSMVENERRLRDAALEMELAAQKADDLASRYW